MIQSPLCPRSSVSAEPDFVQCCLVGEDFRKLLMESFDGESSHCPEGPGPVVDSTRSTIHPVEPLQRWLAEIHAFPRARMLREEADVSPENSENQRVSRPTAQDGNFCYMAYVEETRSQWIQYRRFRRIPCRSKAVFSPFEIRLQARAIEQCPLDEFRVSNDITPGRAQTLPL